MLSCLGRQKNRTSSGSPDGRSGSLKHSIWSDAIFRFANSKAANPMSHPLTRTGAYNITIFGLAVASIMWLIGRWHRNNLVKHPEEVAHLIALARSDRH